MDTRTGTDREWLGAMNDWLCAWAVKEYEVQFAAHRKRGRRRTTFRYAVPQFQTDVIDAMNAGDEERAKALKLSRI